MDIANLNIYVASYMYTWKDFCLSLDMKILSAGSCVMEAASQVISALRDARGKDSKGKGGKGATRKRIIKEEVASLFNKQPKLVAWKHRFVCLGDRKQLWILTTDAEKDQLCRASLGERNVQFDDMELEAEEIREVLFVTFPKLRDVGGFVLCKCLVNSRNLVPLSQFAWSSLKTLKEKVGSARTYIHPLQKDLDLSPEVEEPVGAGVCTHKCYACHSAMWHGVDICFVIVQLHIY